jgi:D-3-phosphoglycerate dehydrogenase
MITKKVLVVDKMHESLEQDFREIGYEIDYQPGIDKHMVREQLIDGHYVGLVVRGKIRVDEKLISGTNLRFVCRAGAGVDNLDLAALKARAIEIINAPEGNRDAVGEHCLGMLLMIMHKIRMGDHEVRNYKWDREGNRGWELKDKTVGIFGYGHMGSSFAEKLAGLGCRVIGYDHRDIEPELPYVEMVNEQRFFEETQILSIHIELNEANYQLIDYNFLKRFSNLTILINSSRGEVLVLSDLVRLLREKELIGVALDVLENEKIDQLSADQKKIFEELKSFPTVIMTPHVAGWTFESYRRINKVLAQKLSALRFA